ncbi:NAD(P)/FAD-dependent oxidoreductase [Glaciecola sp. SC05]|uniref:NAD(P)/FAD-dependent oxidoreductase n=1 Tax=Glaciecola sp. SC05 TaxID=1987355 RepID=UPI003529BA7A
MYDPIKDPIPPADQTLPNSYWASDASNKRSPLNYRQLQGHEQSDVVIIGAGYTGLSCALELSQKYNVSCTVVEANQPGWGCSGRNGGFVLPGTGRLSVQQMTKRWNKKTSQNIYAEYLRSIATVKGFIADGIECDDTAGGYLKLAHKPSLVSSLHDQARALSDDYGDSIIALTKADIAAEYLSGTPAYGGIYYPNAIGINPWLFCQGLAKRVEQAGASIFGASPVISCERKQSKHIVRTELGSIEAKTLIVATNAYGQRRLHPVLTDRTFPVVSSIIVTEPLNQEQLMRISMKAGLMVMDTRALKYYYRVLPDNRLLFGGRGAVYGKDADNKKYLNALKQGLFATFPQLSDIDISHFWSGWVSVSLDDSPRIFHDKSENMLYSAGYCGAGLAFSIQAGKRLAQLLVEPNTLPDLPYWKTPLQRFPLAALRRPALRAFYAWEGIKNTITKQNR